MRTLTAMHWGAFEAELEDGRPVLRPLREDPSPSPIGLDALSDDGRSLAVNEKAGSTFVSIDASTWKISYPDGKG